MAAAIVQVESLSKVYRLGAVDVHALRSISFSVEAGDMVAIIGSWPSGGARRPRASGANRSAS